VELSPETGVNPQSIFYYLYICVYKLLFLNVLMFV